MSWNRLLNKEVRKHRVPSCFENQICFWFFRRCGSFSSECRGSWVTRCCSAPALTRHALSDAVGRSSRPALTRRGTNPPASSCGKFVAPTPSAGERWCQSSTCCFFYRAFLFTVSLRDWCGTDYNAAWRGSNQWNQSLPTWLLKTGFKGKKKWRKSTLQFDGSHRTLKLNISSWRFRMERTLGLTQLSAVTMAMALSNKYM